ncbi:tetratricopeptide repeat protein [Motilimonas eburnea]|uniref:tetratricopeptide repeat protein n=1 Tax=Motilimonas eburnea TaxID=1737488 RepID=UPI001E58B03F|nr:tetratricopeptide repeat protein [Motilimonas eburnea]MCE2570435.1 sel1 repeat family protein [Motilimonas eburnea]
MSTTDLIASGLREFALNTAPQNIKSLQLAYALGDIEAQFSLGWAYNNGDGVEQDFAMAESYILPLAQYGHTWAAFAMGWMAEHGLKAKYSPKDVFMWYSIAAADHHTWAINNLGAMYQKGQYVDKNLEAAIYYYEISAKQGNALSHKNLADIFYYGEDEIEVDAKRAFYHALQGAKGGNATATYLLAQCYRDGKGVEQDNVYAFELLHHAYQHGHQQGNIIFQLGYHSEKHCQDDDHYQQAIRWYEMAIEQDQDETSCYNLARIYSLGLGVEKDPQKAIALYHQALGHYEDVERLLGKLYLGLTPANVELGVKYLTLAIAKNDMSAMFTLGSAYLEGRGVAKNDALAFKYYLQAGTAGDEDAANNLYCMYRDGTGTEVDLEQSQFWLKRAAELGHHVCQHIYAMALSNSDDEQEQQQALVWFHKAADEGDCLSSSLELGFCYYHGRGCEKQPDKAQIYLTKALGHASGEAHYLLARLYLDLDHPEGKLRTWQLFNQAYELGWSQAAANIGHCLLYGIGVIANHQQAAHWLRLAAEQGDKLSHFHLGVLHFDQGKYESAAHHLEQAQAQVSAAKEYLGAIYLHQYQVPERAYDYLQGYIHTDDPKDTWALYNLALLLNQPDFSKYNQKLSSDLMLKAADFGDAYACEVVGTRYFLGEILPLDKHAAKPYLTLAAEHDLVAAQYTLALYYQEDSDAPDRVQQVIHWYEQAGKNQAEQAYFNLACFLLENAVEESGISHGIGYLIAGADQDCKLCHYVLASMYYLGEGLTKDLIQSRQHLEKSAALGYERAINELAAQNQGHGAGFEVDKAPHLRCLSFD